MHKYDRADSLNHGFTLIELMIVVMIIGVFTAIAVPTMLESNRRKVLHELVAEIHNASMVARTRAMQSRRATVIEVRADRVWVNQLATASCELALDLANGMCVINSASTVAANRDTVFFGAGSSFEKAGAAMCGGFALTGNDCTIPKPLSHTAGFALCYSGRGELWVRPDNGGNQTVCSATAQPAPVTSWEKVCGSPALQSLTANGESTFPGDRTVGVQDGAFIVLNRFDSGCAATSDKDVRQAIFFPSGGAPYSRMAP